MTEIKLPKKKIPAAHLSPSTLIIMSEIKLGKTSLVAGLDNCLLIELEPKRADHVEALKIYANSVDEIAAIGKQIKEEDFPYKYVALDTLTALERICISYAEILYSRKLVGKNWFKKNNDGTLAPDSGKAIYGDILSLPKGAGYKYLKEAVLKVIEMVKKMAPYVIFVGHLQEVGYEKNGVETTCLELDMTGKLRRLIPSMVDSVGYMYRKQPNVNYISFIASSEVKCGGSAAHIRNKEFPISELITHEDGTEEVVTHWDKIYID